MLVNQSVTHVGELDHRNGDYPDVKFDFLGYTFKSRDSKNKEGKLFRGFLPAVGDKASVKIREKLVEMKIHSSTSKTLKEIAEASNPVIRGWINYYGQFYKSALNKVLESINDRLAKWAVKKYKRFHGSIVQARNWLLKIKKRDPKLFAHW